MAVAIDGSEPQVFENKFKEYSPNWKDQVVKNGAHCRMTFTIDPKAKKHSIRIMALDPGQMIQRLVIDWGGLKKSYLGPSWE